jgi:septum site-determining protein MinC
VGNIVLAARQHPDAVNYESATRSVLTIYRTVRGGQEIRYNGSIIIFGDINPTARIFAENDIIVAGVTRGILYAGCRGDRSAAIAAGSFNGGQIRIADLIVRAPDEPSGAIGFGVARIYNNQIEIRTIRR